ncbi:MAG: glycosyltransferase [SAR324 cluster bacterium]|uniref:Glycosyltransferase n=1 Tax=SAR324 cluster bacterium TaxID=2024889 RepID=A0A2A4T3R2_9DELT|nr:MAG: glycosyltransferase [SAR324 cluster bacterium]
MIKYKILSSMISSGGYRTVLDSILKLSKVKDSSYICVSNVHMLIESYKSKNFNAILNEADISTPDGMPLARAMKLLYGINQDRISGMDLMPDIMKISEKQNLSIFMYGSTDEVLDKIITKAKEEFLGLTLTTYSPPFKVLSIKEKEDIVTLINAKEPDFVFVALGCPKQEKWMAEHKGKINSCMIGLGGALEVYAGVKERAPKWMQDNSLEWLYRLKQDPKRLWKRYFVTNTLFIILFINQFIKIRIFKRFD